MSEFPLAGMRILLMEDEALIAMDVEQLCRDSGADDVVIVRSLSHLGSSVGNPRDFHAAIVDLMLSGDSTMDFARSLVEHDVPFVFATGYTDHDVLRADFPNIPVIGKPYVGSDLVDAVARAARSGSRV